MARQGFVDLCVDLVIAFVVILVVSALCLSILVSHIGVPS